MARITFSNNFIRFIVFAVNVTVEEEKKKKKKKKELLLTNIDEKYLLTFTDRPASLNIISTCRSSFLRLSIFITLTVLFARWSKF